VRQLIETRAPFVSPIVELELTYLHEARRVIEPAVTPLSALRKTIGLQIDDVPLRELVQAATGLTWTRDPFDRMIAAHALVADAPLLTADRTMLEHLPLATWE
jgi:PIN domain nuclease of toxin-antitoxin system